MKMFRRTNIKKIAVGAVLALSTFMPLAESKAQNLCSKPNFSSQGMLENPAGKYSLPNLINTTINFKTKIKSVNFLFGAKTTSINIPARFQVGILGKSGYMVNVAYKLNDDFRAGVIFNHKNTSGTAGLIYDIYKNNDAILMGATSYNFDTQNIRFCLEAQKQFGKTIFILSANTAYTIDSKNILKYSMGSQICNSNNTYAIGFNSTKETNLNKLVFTYFRNFDSGFILGANAVFSTNETPMFNIQFIKTF